MATKMTAVQWLEIAVQNKLASEMGPYFAEAFEHAKAMEKEQIEHAFYFGTEVDSSNVKSPYKEAEQYYTSTFNS